MELEETFHALCLRFRPHPHIELADDAKEFKHLLKELVRCLAESTLFTFVLDPDVGAGQLWRLVADTVAESAIFYGTDRNRPTATRFSAKRAV